MSFSNCFIQEQGFVVYFSNRSIQEQGFVVYSLSITKPACRVFLPPLYEQGFALEKPFDFQKDMFI